MIKVYEATETQFLNNGIKIIKPERAQVFKEDNGEYYLELEASTKYIEWLQQNNIVRVNTPWGEQGFRLNNPEITRDLLTFKAKHLFYDSERYLLIDVYPQDLNCNDSLNWILQRTVPGNNFTTTSDIIEQKSSRYIRKSLLETILSHLNLYGGHLYRNNFEFGINNQIGVDRGVTLMYGKNIEGLKAFENWDDVVTKILPVGYNGVTLPEQFLISDVQYNIPYVKSIQFNPSENIDIEDTNEVLYDLRVQAQEYLEVNKYPRVNYELKAHLNGIVDIGDTIKVNYPQMGIDLYTEVISVKYDCLAKKFGFIQFGNFRKTLKKLVQNFTKQINDLQGTAQETLNTIALYTSEFTQDLLELRSTFTKDLYGIDGNGGLNELIQTNKSNITQTAEQILTEVSRATAKENQLSSSITQTAEEIALKVSKDGVISSINQSAEEIRIAASRLVLDGLVTLVGLSGGTTLINGDCIKTGTIDAERISTNIAQVAKELRLGALNDTDRKVISFSDTASIYSIYDSIYMSALRADLNCNHVNLGITNGTTSLYGYVDLSDAQNIEWGNNKPVAVFG